jgi:hypothetical protein
MDNRNRPHFLLALLIREAMMTVSARSGPTAMSTLPSFKGRSAQHLSILRRVGFDPARTPESPANCGCLQSSLHAHSILVMRADTMPAPEIGLCMRRREFIISVGGFGTARPVAAKALVPERLRRKVEPALVTIPSVRRLPIQFRSGSLSSI